MEQVKVTEVQFHPWDRSYYFDPAGFDLKLGDRVIVETSIGEEIGKIIGFGMVAPEELESELEPIKRMPTESDFEQLKGLSENKEEELRYGREKARSYELPMKLISVVHSFDDKRLTFTFTANSRVDFRELVKELTTHFQRQIRLQQIGSRDVTAEMGGVGSCGRPTCCSTWKATLDSVSSDLIQLQQLEHRGSDRLSGLCGRLKCCLSYESEGYRVCADAMPEVGAHIRTRTHGEGVVVARNLLTHEITLKDSEGKRVDIKMGCEKVGCSGCSAGSLEETKS
ncbi:MAG: regulatory iron-sulfur-containing complex subunit RicT [Candidatus Kerfeldbacteria bacterium]